MDKYEYIVNLAEKTAKRVSQNRESWMKFLTSAARIYKYPFKEQLLIYAQNPDATACASIEIWNKRMNCWVNKGSSGIALPDDIATYGHKLKYVFDALILEDDEQPAIVNSDMAVTPITSVKTKPMLKKKVVGLCL